MSKTIELTAENFDKEVLQAGLPVLVDFWAPWCPVPHAYTGGGTTGDGERRFGQGRQGEHRRQPECGRGLWHQCGSDRDDLQERRMRLTKPRRDHPRFLDALSCHLSAASGRFPG